MTKNTLIQFAATTLLIAHMMWGSLSQNDCLADDAPVAPTFESSAVPFFQKNCVSCHGAKKQEGKLTLHDISPEMNTARGHQKWMLVLEQLESGDMPPEDELPQPSKEQRSDMIAWIQSELTLVSDVFERNRSHPKYGNYVSHEELFSGKHKGPSYSFPRIWRLSPYIDSRNGSSPFSLSSEEGFKDYAHMWSLDESTLQLLLMRAEIVVKKQIGPSADDLVILDKQWREQILKKRKYLQFHVEDLKKKIAENPENSGFKGKLAENSKNLDKNLAIDLESSKDLPSRRAKGSWSKNGFNRIAYGTEIPSEELRQDAVSRQLSTATRRNPTDADIDAMQRRLEDAIAKYGNHQGLVITLTSILLSPESIYRLELGLGEAASHDRRKLSQVEIAYALGYALSDKGPDRDIQKSFASGELGDPKVIRAHVERIYDNAITTEKNSSNGVERVFRFFREYFEYDRATEVFKDGTRHPGHKPNAVRLVGDTDVLIKHLLKSDKEVLKTLLTTQTSFPTFMTRRSDWQTQTSYNLTGKHFKKEDAKFINGNGLNGKYSGSRWIVTRDNRSGILTQPSWLMAHSGNFDNDPIKRGKWIYTHLLGGVIPDVPITVDAKVPADHDKSLRKRLQSTRAEYCWKCHGKMNPLGMAFEMYDDVGRFREKELLRDNKTFVPVDSHGVVPASGDPQLDGPVENSLELLQKLADSPRVRQVFVRHAFRYWMGRNETLDDSPTLIAADKAYVASGGSMKALIASLLSSDSFLYRKESELQRTQPGPPTRKQKPTPPKTKVQP